MMLKRFAALLLVGLLFVGAAFANDIDEETQRIERALNELGSGIVGSLSHYNTLGLGWSDAYIGQLFSMPPSFGVGVTVGAATIPLNVLTGPLGELDIDSDEMLADLPASGVVSRVGLPLPAYTFDARVGGFGIPFDVGFKLGTVPTLAMLEDQGVELDFLLVGGDFRYALLDGSGILPKLSAGLGFNHSRFGVGVTMEDMELAEDEVGGEDVALVLGDPRFDFGWRSSSVELKAQASKRLLIFQPFLGAGVAYNWASMGGSFSGQLTMDGDAFDELSDDDREELEEMLGEYLDNGDVLFGFDVPDSGFTARAFGGLGLRIFILNLDVGASIDTRGSVGLELNTRIQF